MDANYARALQTARHTLSEALRSGTHRPAAWHRLDFLCPDQGVAIRLRDGPATGFDDAVSEADCTASLEADAGIRLLWFTAGEVLGDLDRVLACIDEALEDGAEDDPDLHDLDLEEELEASMAGEDMPSCPLFAQVALPPTCRYCRNATAWPLPP